MSNKEIISLVNTLNSKLAQNTKVYIKELEKDDNLLIKFKLLEAKELSNLFNKNKEICGIYYFQIKFNDDIPKDNTKIDFLINEWTNKREHIPPIIKKNINNKVTRDYWIPFYIGKCEKVYARVKQHLVGESTTSSLRLNEIDSRIFKNAEYKISTLNLEKFNGDNYWVVSKIEKNIREELNPICGR